MFSRQIEPGGEVTVVTEYTDSGRIAEIQRSGTVGGNPLTEAFVYQFDDDDRLTSVLLRRQADSDPWQDVQQALYEYYDGEEEHGSLGDLKLVRIEVAVDSQWEVTETSYYRYYTDDDLEHGFIHGLKYVVKPATFDRMVADNIDPLTATDVLLGQSADNYFQYDSHQRVTLERIEGGSRTFTFDYINSSNAIAPNVWKSHTVETRPDGSQMTIYANSIGQPLIRKLSKTGVGAWIDAYHYDANYRRLWHASPSAVIGYDDNQPDLAITLRDDAGLIEETEYYTTTGGGAVAGYLAARKLRHGSSGTPVPQFTLEYSTHTAGGVTVHPVAKQTTYQSDAGGDPTETTLAYSFHSGTTQVAETITTLPIVPTAQNGTNTAATRRDYRDMLGRPTWSMDERGFISHRTYNLATGAIAQIIQDVDTSVVSGAPAGWNTPSGGGLNLVTDFQHDDQGRLLQTLGPIHSVELSGTPTSIRRATWNVYDDVQHITYSASGYLIPATSTFVLINPVSIIKRKANGKLLESIQAVAPSTNGTLAQIIDNAGGGATTFPQSSYTRWTTYQYSDCCHLASQRVYFDIPTSGFGNPEGNYNETQYGYDSMRRLDRVVSPGGTVNHQTFDVRSLLVQTSVGIDDQGVTIDSVLLSENQYDHGSDGGDGNLTSQTQYVSDTETRVTDFAYDWRNRQIDQAFNVLRQEPAGAMEYQTFEYDSLGRRVSATNPLDESTLYSFDDAGNQISTTDPNEEVWTRGYDPLGRLVRSTNPLDESTTYGFNDAGAQTTVTNALSETTTSTFDDAGRLIAVSDPLDQVTTYSYDANGNQVSITDPNDLTTISQYDFRDRLIKVTDPLDDSTQYAYNRVGELIVETDAKNHDTTHAYDSLGREVSTTDRLDQTTSFAWNPLGMQASLTDAQNQTTSYQYDEFTRLHLTIWPDHQNGTSPGDQNYGITKTEYDSLNRVLRTTDQLGDTIKHVYDAAGRLLAKDYRTLANSPSGTIADSDTFTFDATGRLLTAVSDRYTNTVTLNYDAAGRKSTESLTISGQTYTSTTVYDAAGRVAKLTYPDASEVTRTHTARGQLATLALDATTIDTRVYDNGGRMTSSSYNNGVSESRTYNDDNTLASINYTGAAIGNLSYTWDANKNKMSETIGGVMSGFGFTAGYDADDRLVSWDRADSALDQSWNLSPVGNWNSFTENASTQVRTHSPANEILTAATEDVFHDPKGNTTLIPPVLRTSTDPLKIKWDFDNKLRAADTNDDNTDDIFYKWDALGRRVGRDDGTTNVVYFQDGQQTLADYTAGTSAASPTYKYVFASYIDEIVARIDSSDDILYYHRNQQYSITAVSDGGGSVVERYAYSAYGQVTFADASGSAISNSAISNRYTYTGREWDEGLNLYHYRARMYEAVGGRFCSRDPIGYDGSPWCLYQYVLGQSLVSTDPYGLARWALNRVHCDLTPSDSGLEINDYPNECLLYCSYECFAVTVSAVGNENRPIRITQTSTTPMGPGFERAFEQPIESCGSCDPDPPDAGDCPLTMDQPGAWVKLPPPPHPPGIA